MAPDILRLRRIPRLLSIALFSLMLWPAVPVPAAADGPAPRVVVSIKSLHSLVAAVMQGVGEPTLLIDGAGSPHNFALKPSQARALHNADAVFWAGAGLERFLIKPLETLSRRARVVALASTVPALPVRAPGVWKGGEAIAHDETQPGRRDEHEHGATDPHFWLDPVPMRSAVGVVVRTLSEIDRSHADRYRENGDIVASRLDDLHGRLDAKLAPVRAVPYLVFHDAYQYFERRYRLHAAGTVTLSPDYAPGARHLESVRQLIARGGVRCIFREPQFRPRILDAIAAENTVRIVELDPLGASIAAGPDAYFRILEQMGDSLAGCLTGGTG